MEMYEGTWRMVCIGSGPGPKNVLAERIEDGKKLVVAYPTWKFRLVKATVDTERVHFNAHTRSTTGGAQVDLQVGIIQVAVRTTGSGRQIFDISCSDGKTRAVWDAGLANAINAFAGSGAQITIRVKVSQRGQYTNETITAFAPPGQALPPEAEGGGNGGNGGGFRRGGGGMSPEDKTRIAKMGAQGSAATLVASLFTGAGPEAYDEALALMDKLTRKLYTEARSHEKSGGDVPAAQGTILQPGATVTEQIAASVPGVVVGATALPPGGAADASAAADVVAQQSEEQPEGTGIEWN